MKFIFYSLLSLIFFCSVVLGAPIVTKKIADFEDILATGKVIGRVYFKLMDSNLDSQAKEELKRLAEELSNVEASFIVRIEGFTDSSQEKKMGILLSMQRAQAVKLYMKRNFPHLKIEFYMTGFGEARPLVPREGELIEEVREKERRVDLVAYMGASFFQEEEPPKMLARKSTSEVPPVKRRQPKKEQFPVVREADEIVVAARSFKRVIFSEDFFDEGHILKEEAKPILNMLLKDVKADNRWIFIASGGGAGLSAFVDDSVNDSLKKQFSMAREIIANQGINPERIFIKGIDAVSVIPHDVDGTKGELYLYIPLP